MASAKLANRTVNHSQSVICRLNLKAAPPRNSSTVVITLPTSTTNLTGLPILVVQYRGISGNDLEQFKKPGTQIVLYPDEYKSGEIEAPYSDIKH